MARHVWHWSLALAATFSIAAFAQDTIPQESIVESRRIAARVATALRTQLLKEMQASGPLRSLVVCKYTCPELISGPARRTGWKISAVSLKPRNPAMGAPDAWEQKILLEFTRRVDRGEKADGMEKVEIVSEPQGRYFRYAVSMVVEPLCLTCHGARDSLPSAVKTQLEIDYPFDKAVDFADGQLYGVVSVKHAY